MLRTQERRDRLVRGGICRKALTLLVPRIRAADDEQTATPLDELAGAANATKTTTDPHNVLEQETAAAEVDR